MMSSQVSSIFASAAPGILVIMLLLTVYRGIQANTYSFMIDCGIDQGADYEDSDTQISYISDSNSIDTGVNMKISEEYLSAAQNFQKLLTTVRSFPEGDNNCYTLNPGKASANKYLIRAFFMYGNYDSMNQPPSFDLYLDVNQWDHVNFTDASEIVIKEIIHYPKTYYIHICLVDIGEGTPFISALEVREVNSSIYKTQFDDSLVLYRRLDHGSTSPNKFERYSDDFYARIWEPYGWTYWNNISATITGEYFSDNDYKPSAFAMSTAVQPLNESDPIEFYHTSERNQQFYLYLYFFEVAELESNQTRKFNIYLKNGLWNGPVTPNNRPNTAYSTYSVGGTNSLDFSIKRTSDSTLPPILNAMEYYMVKTFSQLPTEESDAEAVINIKRTYGIKKNWQGDPCKPVNFRWDGLECNINDLGESKIISLNLSFSGLTDAITSSFSQLDSLQSLDLSHNFLKGTVPDFLAQMNSLRNLNLSGNQLTGLVPLALVEKLNNGSLMLSVDGNKGLCFSEPCKKKETKMNDQVKIALIIVLALVMSCLIISAIAVIISKSKRKTKDKSNVPKRQESIRSKNRIFKYSEIVEITERFQTAIGRGGSGVVYLGYLEDGSKVAVKMFSPSAAFGLKEFQTEVQLLLRIHHRNLTPLVGYCSEETNMALVYEYMAHGNLQEHLSEKNSIFLTWKERVQIAVDAVQGLEYLHNGCKPPIIHRDMKSANILLNEKLKAKVADFGLSRIIATESDTHVSTVVAGTHGYLDPEYSLTFKLSEKSDVYSFGIVLLELITGQPAIIRDTNHEAIHIVAWIKRRLENGDIREIVDPKLRGQFKINSAWKLLETAMACIPPIAIERISMNNVLTELKECLAMEMSHERGSSLEDISTSTRSDQESGPTAR